MPALVAGIHALMHSARKKTWMAGTSPAMTKCIRTVRNAKGNAMRTTPLAIVMLALGMLAMGASRVAPAQTAQAQSWPQTTVKLILPLGPGSATDVTARLYAERLALRWGQPVVVENRPGPDGLVAVAAFMAARGEEPVLVSLRGGGPPYSAPP